MLWNLVKFMIKFLAELRGTCSIVVTVLNSESKDLGSLPIFNR